ncbi:hypothetical protein CLOM_g10121 [Closterium sp. NIES-68]|nr:hypothetical protein CLOM_g10121 [Closterium sp. NIES-68]
MAPEDIASPLVGHTHGQQQQQQQQQQKYHRKKSNLQSQAQAQPQTDSQVQGQAQAQAQAQARAGVHARAPADPQRTPSTHLQSPFQPFQPHKADAWSLGVVLYALLSGRLPFLAQTDSELAELICQGEVDLEEDPWHEVGGDAKRLLLRLLVLSPESRAAPCDVLDDPWLVRHGVGGGGGDKVEVEDRARERR